ncbi:MAG: hypothetical protein U9Q22_01335, partial [Candidatus Altiarchaeota archaeon]|nr:hypothetical protein [Candidatus Altiarchaeota archaeon]
MRSSKIRTGLNSLVNIVSKKGEFKLTDAAKMLDIDETSLEGLVKILVEHEILEVHYSIVGDKILRKGAKIKGTVSRQQIKETVDETLTSEKIEEREETKRIERLLDVMKKRIAEKKNIAPEAGETRPVRAEAGRKREGLMNKGGLPRDEGLRRRDEKLG